MINIIYDKQYFELTPDELAEISEFCDGEDSFNQIKEVFVAVEALKYPKETPSPEIKQSLDDLFLEKHRGTSAIWYSSMLSIVAPKEKPMHRQPLAQIAAVAVIVFLTFPLWNVSENRVEKISLAEMKKNEVSQSELNEKVSDDGSVEAGEYNVISKLNKEVNITPTSEISAPEEDVNDEVFLDMAMEEELNGSATPMAPSSTVSQPHSDILFESESSLSSTYSVSAADKPEILDLLTATF